MPAIKQPGLCTLCGEEIFEIVSRYPSSHVLAGEIRGVGLPLPGARRVYFVLQSGMTCAVSFCVGCAETLRPESYPEVWRRCTEVSMREYDPEFRRALGVKPMDEDNREKLALGVLHDLPLTIRSITRWDEELGRTV